jgi:hypothetical protein
MTRSTKERTKRWHEKEGLQHTRQDAHEQLKQGEVQVGREDHRNLSTLHHMVSSCSNDEGNILK